MALVVGCVKRDQPLCPADYEMIDKLNEIWQTLGALIARHPSVAILLIFLLLVGGNIQRWLDGREIRGLKAENKRLRTDKDATESRLKLAQDEQKAVAPPDLRSDPPSATIGSEDKYPSPFSPPKSDDAYLKPRRKT